MLIGRENEVRVLKGALTCETSEFIAVYGRRGHGWRSLLLELH